MNDEYLNRFCRGLRELCADRILDEKWLVAPSRRVGFQWLDAVTRSGQPLLNVRVKTLVGMALELAAPEMERRGASFASGIQMEILLDGIMSGLSVKGGYIRRLQATSGLVHAVAATLRDLRLAGVGAAHLSPRLFEDAAKGREIAYLLSGYEEELRLRSLMDYADMLRAAAERLAEDASSIARETLVIMPSDMRDKLRGLEQALWEEIPPHNRAVLEVDLPGEARRDDGSDASLMAWISDSGEAPPPRGDGTVEIFRAVGEINEVREVLRRCVERKIPFDQVELLHTEASTYVPLIYELLSSHAAEAGGPLPVTFSEGVPVRYSRPGRALAGLISWTSGGYPQSTLVHMIQDDLLEAEEPGETGSHYGSLGSALAELPIGAGRERYLPAIDAAISTLQWRSKNQAQDGSGENTEENRTESLQRRLEILLSLRRLVVDLLECAPSPGNTWRKALDGAAGFLLRRARCLNEFDAYSRMRMLDEIEELTACLQGKDPSLLSVMDWLSELARSARVEGKGPRPGCLYVAPLATGGHSGRAHTFVLGLDDGRFPMAGFQDPLLLDSERERIHDDLATTSESLAASLEEFADLMARIRSAVTMSYCCRDLSEDREMFPSPVVLSAYRILSGNHHGVLGDLINWLPPPLSFAPRSPLGCIDAAEWWLNRLCGELAFEDPEGAVARAYPHLGRGIDARRARQSDEFTAYDGYVPEAGKDLDPTGADAPVLSASRLEKLGRCPMEFFFQYVLGIEKPEERALEPWSWLDPTERGRLLHAVFRKFLHLLYTEERKPALDNDTERLQSMLDEEVSAWRARKPPPNREVFQAELEELRRTANIFLQEEELLRREREPLYFEVAIGLKAQGEGNLIDTPEPAAVELPGGKIIRARGYIDRVDRLEAEPGCFALCDYKTGSSREYRRDDPFQKGRRVQNALYMAMVESRLAEHHPGAEVISFEYFFPNTREHGERIAWNREGLAGGRAILGVLCEMLATGCFPFTDNADDIRNSDFRPAFGDIGEAVRAAQAKLANPCNAALSPFRKLRGYQGEEG